MSHVRSATAFSSTHLQSAPLPNHRFYSGGTKDRRLHLCDEGQPACWMASMASSPTRGRQQDSRWLRTLSEPELDLLISLKDLAMAYTDNASLAVLGHDYDLPTLHALGIVLLETLKEQLKGTSIDPSIFDRLSLLSDSDAYFPSIASDSESEGVRSKTKKTPMGVNGKRKQTQAGWLSEEGRKKRAPASQRLQ